MPADDVFEVRAADGAGRVGELSVPRAGLTVETPALLPVVNPNVLTVEPRRLYAEFGVEMLITNSYIVHSTDGLREAALSRGLHDLLDFPGAIMTDSGSFQLAEYGSIDVDTPQILAFQRAVGSDVGTPVDVPTPPDADRDRALADLRDTEAALLEAERAETGEMLVSAPVQGSTHLDLRESAGRAAAASALDLFPVGAVVPLLNSYRYDDVVRVVAAAKRGLGPAAPVHLFGAGHPMTFALAAALGCDLFDSAAYALYARDGRYLTPAGTEHLADLSHLPCPCPVCVETDPDALRERGDDERERLLAEHNLHVTLAEVRRVREAVRSGTLFELVERRARGHPALVDGYRALLDERAWLERGDPVSKGTFFAVSAESARRPEVARHHDRLPRVAPPDDARVLLTEGGVPSADRFDAVWRVLPPFGPYPRALASTYPLTAEVPDRPDRAAYEAAARGVARLADATGAELTLAHDGWPATALARVPDSVSLTRLGDHGPTPTG
ncbi:MAG: tRNA guanosine(15) transglycosylase TgtA [Haloferacaceae archaeon]